jgi:hypothetical protein
MNRLRLALSFSLLTLGTIHIALGAGPCPTPGLSNFQGSNQAYLTAGGGCNVIITIAANGSVTTTTVNANPYDGSDDTLVGVINNSSTALPQITVSGSNISGFEGDGICAFGAGGIAGDTFTSGSSAYCSTAALNGTDPQDYQGPNQTFTNFSSGNAVTVVFSPAIAGGGGTNFFSLEEPPSNSLTITTPTGTPTGVPPTPAPASLILLATGIAAMGVYYMIKRQRSVNR